MSDKRGADVLRCPIRRRFPILLAGNTSHTRLRPTVYSTGHARQPLCLVFPDRMPCLRSQATAKRRKGLAARIVLYMEQPEELPLAALVGLA